MANLDELDMEDLQILHGGLMAKLTSYPRELTESERFEVAVIGRLIRQIDLAMEEAYEETRGMVRGANLDLFERGQANIR